LRPPSTWPGQTIRDYLTLLERVFLLEELPPWHSNPMSRLREVTGSRIKAGVVLYDGETCLGFGDRLFAVPVRALWEKH
jgi:hypothetical protein